MIVPICLVIAFAIAAILVAVAFIGGKGPLL